MVCVVDRLAATIAVLTMSVAAQTPGNLRYGRWKLESDAPAPQGNVMTYEPLSGGKGITRSSTRRAAR